MSVSGVDSIGPDLTTMVRLNMVASAQTTAATPVATAAAQPIVSAQDIAAQNALNAYIEGEAPTDDSIGLYSEDVGAAAVQGENAEAALASQLQSTADLQEQTLLQALEVKDVSLAETAAEMTQVARDVQMADAAQSGAVAAIDRQMTEALTAARLNAAAGDFQSLLQASEAGDAANASIVAASLQTHLASLDQATLNQAFASISQHGQPPLPAQAQALIALAQSGDMAAAATLARTISAQVSASWPSGSTLTALIASLPPSSLSILDLDANPLLLAVQLNMLLRAKTTIERLRRREVDHIRILPIPGLGEGEFHEDKARTDE